MKIEYKIRQNIFGAGMYVVSISIYSSYEVTTTECFTGTLSDCYAWIMINKATNITLLD